MAAEKKESKTQLYVSNLPVGASSQRLEDAFTQFGKITDAFIPHRGSRFGFVDFEEPKAATAAMEAMDGKPLDKEASEEPEPSLIGVIRAKERPAGSGKKPAKEEASAPKKSDEAPTKRAPKKEPKEPNAWSKEAREKKDSKKDAPAAKSQDRTRLSKKDLDTVCDKFFNALSQDKWNKAAECFAPGAECFSPQRTGAKAQSFHGFSKTMGGMFQLLGSPTYQNVRRLYGPDSVVEQHTTKFNRTRDTTVDAEACVLLRLNADGLIVRMDEYLDPTAVLKAVQIAANAQ